MSLNSTLAALICNIKVSIKHNKPVNRCVFSNLNISVLTKLVHNGMIKSFKVNDIRKGVKEIQFELTTLSGEIILNEIKMISKPGQRIYLGSNFNGFIKYIKFFDCGIISTSKGLMNHKECVKGNIGGEMILVYR